MPKSKKLLIRLSSAGDVILTSPLLKLMRKRDADIHFVVKSNYSDLVRYNPNISVLHLVQEHAGINQLERLRRQLIAEKFDETLDLHNNFRTVYLRRGTAKKISVIKKDVLKRTALVNFKLNLFSEVRSAALKYAQVYDKTLDQVPRPEIFYPPEMNERIIQIWKQFESKGRKSVFLCPGSRHFTKRWPAQNWNSLSKLLTAQQQVVLIGGTADVEVCRSIEEDSPVTNFAGRFTMLESAAILSFADLVITNDSFLMHAANGLGKKVIAILGSSVKEFGFFPYGVENKIIEVEGLDCRPCSHIGKESCPRKHFRCMLETTPEMVYRAAAEMLT